MLQKLKVILLLFVSVVAFNIFISNARAGALTAAATHTQYVPKPVIVEVNQDSIKNKQRPIIKGLTVKGTDVLIYIDGEYQGQAIINNEGTATDNFYFEAVSDLRLGGHRVRAEARNRSNDAVSRMSVDYSFKVSELPPVPAPTLIQAQPTSNTKPLITGLTINGSSVHVYIDGAYNGKTELRKHNSGTANFAYMPYVKLEQGKHKIAVVAEDELGRKSQMSAAMVVNVEEPLPAPVILNPASSANNMPTIVGVAKNNLKVEVYVDDKLAGAAKVKNDESKTASFAFTPEKALTPGLHTIHTIATDNRGKVSKESNSIYVNVPEPLKPMISGLAVAEDNSVPVINIKEKAVKQPADNTKAAANANPTKNPEEKVNVAGFEKNIDEIKKEEKEAEEIRAIINQDKEEKEDTGLINEDKKGLSEVQWNLIISIFFLIAVILWIIWVNRELIKEKNLKNADKTDTE